MISTNVSSTETVRNVFIIDDKGVVRVILVYPLNVGRCIPEILRIIEALQTADCNKGATPANWIPGEPIIIPVSKTCEELKNRVKEIRENRNGFSWYLSFKESSKKCDEINEENICCKK